MTAAEAIVAAAVIALCVAVSITRGRMHPWASALLSTLAVLAALAVTLHWALGHGGAP